MDLPSTLPGAPAVFPPVAVTGAVAGFAVCVAVVVSRRLASWITLVFPRRADCTWLRLRGL